MTNARIIRNWIKQFSDQKLAEVYAFNQDRKMSFTDPCGCILGVSGSTNLHIKWRCGLDTGHYTKIKYQPGAAEAEQAYLRLGFFFPLLVLFGESRCRRLRLASILKAEMRERDRQRAKIRIAREAEEPVIQRQEEGVTCSQLQD